MLNLFIFDANGNEISDIVDEIQKNIDSPESMHQELPATQSIKNHNQDDLAYLSSYL